MRFLWTILFRFVLRGTGNELHCKPKSFDVALTQTQAKRYLRCAHEKYPDTTLMACVILFTKTGEIKFWKCKSSPGRNKLDVTVEHSTPESIETQGQICSQEEVKRVKESQPECLHVHELK